jgi:glutathione S-transferase
MTIIVHHLENSRSQRVLWLLEELGMPYEVKRYERNKKQRARKRCAIGTSCTMRRDR